MVTAQLPMNVVGYSCLPLLDGQQQLAALVLAVQQFATAEDMHVA
jgi:hypothetical protein